MFSNNKRPYKSILILSICALLITIVHLASGQSNTKKEITPEKTTSLTEYDLPTINQEKDIGKEVKQEDEKQTDISSSGYLMREEAGVVNIYFIDAQGKETFLRDTNIVFSLLSQEDQNLLSKGLYLETEDDIQAILQDYES